MGITLFLIPTALAAMVSAAALAWEGARRKNRGLLLGSGAMLLLLSAGAAVLMEFITRPL